MSILNQKTLNKKISISGVGLHSGVASTINILPASPNTGIVFKRIDIKNNNIVFPNYSDISNNYNPNFNMNTSIKDRFKLLESIKNSIKVNNFTLKIHRASMRDGLINIYI